MSFINKNISITEDYRNPQEIDAVPFKEERNGNYPEKIELVHILDLIAHTSNLAESTYGAERLTEEHKLTFMLKSHAPTYGFYMTIGAP